MELIVITIGTRDVQLDLSGELSNQVFYQEGLAYIHICEGEPAVPVYPDRTEKSCWFFSEARDSGRILTKAFDLWAERIRLPLTGPFLEYLAQKSVPLRDCQYLLIVSDQPVRAGDFRKNDTLYFGKVFCRKISSKREASIEQFKQWELAQLTDLDFLYKDLRFRIRQNGQQGAVPDKVHLFAQGGIDQVNQALTLQLIQYYGHALTCYQKAEGDRVREMRFPATFLNDLSRINLVKHVKDRDFDKVDEGLCAYPWVVAACRYLESRLSLRPETSNKYYEKLRSEYQRLKGVKKVPFLPDRIEWSTLKKTEQQLIRLVDIYLSAKVDYDQSRTNAFLLKLFSFAENLYKCMVDEVTGTDSRDIYNKKKDKKTGGPGGDNMKWISYLNSVDPEAAKWLMKEGVFLHNPSRRGYALLFRRLWEKGKAKREADMVALEKADNALDALTGYRNQIAHNMGATSAKEVKGHLVRNCGSVEAFFLAYDQLLGIKGFSYIDPIREAILQQMEEDPYN